MTRFDQIGEPSVAVQQSHSAVVPPRPQPEGLKARFLPMGVTVPADNDVSGMTKASPLTATATVTTPRSKADKKRKHTSAGGEALVQQETAAPESTKKAKKARISESSQPPAKVTPILPPSIPGSSASKGAIVGAAPSNPPRMASSSLPPSDRKYVADNASRSSTQPTAGKRPAVPLPPQTIHPMADAPLSPDLSASTPTQHSKKNHAKSKKSKRAQVPSSDNDASERKTVNDLGTPRKETPIPPPVPGNQA